MGMGMSINKASRVLPNIASYQVSPVYILLSIPEISWFNRDMVGRDTDKHAKIGVLARRCCKTGVSSHFITEDLKSKLSQRCRHTIHHVRYR